APWGVFALAQLWLAATWRLPWRLTRFLRDAHDLGILRQSGAVYQFRHARLRDRLASVRQPDPAPAAASTRPARRRRPAVTATVAMLAVVVVVTGPLRPAAPDPAPYRDYQALVAQANRHRTDDPVRFPHGYAATLTMTIDGPGLAGVNLTGVGYAL